MKRNLLIFLAVLSFSFCLKSSAQITLLDSFNPSATGSICGIGYDSETSSLWIYGCSFVTIENYDHSGNLLNTFNSPGGAANDVDVEISPEELTLNTSTIAQGHILFVNGESNTAEIYAIDNSTGNIVDTLDAQFGNSHVVGGSYHSERNTFFLVQDNVPGATLRNMIAEIDPVTGDTLHTFQISEFFNVSYGDIEVGDNGNLFVVSSIEESIAEFTPDGIFLQTHALPEGVTDLSGIALDCTVGEAWVSSTNSMVYHLGQFPCLTSGIKEIANQHIVLSEISPNPFVSEFNFSIEMKQRAQLKLILVNMMGQEAKLIYDGMADVGKQDFTISEQSLQKGVYILVAESNAFKHSKRVVCIR